MNEDEYEDEGVEPDRWTWLVPVAVGLNTLANLGRVWATTFGEISVRVVQHKLWTDRQKEFQDEVRLGLEALPESADNEGDRP